VRTTQGPRRQRHQRERGIQHRLIDRQIWLLHQAMVDKILLQPALLAQVKTTLERRYAEGNIYYGAYLTWHCIVEQISQPELFKQSVLEDSMLMRKYRRVTPFVGILSEEERLTALQSG
jgi:hypothetical protein